MDAPRTKEFVIAAVVALYTVAFFSIAALSFRGQQEWSVSFGSFLGVAGILWVMLFAMASVLTSRRSAIANILAIVPSLTLIAFGGMNPAAIAGAAILLGLTLGAQSSIARELTSHIKIRTSTVFSFGVRLLFFGMLLSFIVLSIPIVRDAIVRGDIGIPSGYIETVAGPISPTLSAINPSYNADTIGVQVNEYIQKRANNDSLLVTIVVMAIALLAIRTVVPVISIVALAGIGILFWGAKSAGLFAITEKNVPVESIEL